jgi:hypothetical protein
MLGQEWEAEKSGLTGETSHLYFKGGGRIVWVCPKREEIPQVCQWIAQGG